MRQHFLTLRCAALSGAGGVCRVTGDGGQCRRGWRVRGATCGQGTILRCGQLRRLYARPADLRLDRGWARANGGGFAINMLSAKYAEGSLHFNPAQGYQALDLTGSYNQGRNGVQQSFKTYAGRQYTVTFSVGHADRALYLPDSLVQVVVNGTPIGTADNAAVTPDMINWQVFSYRFTATGRAAVIGFYNASTASDYVGLDAVSVTIVPKPAPDDLARGMRR